MLWGFFSVVFIQDRKAGQCGRATQLEPAKDLRLQLENHPVYNSGCTEWFWIKMFLLDWSSQYAEINPI